MTVFSGGCNHDDPGLAERELTPARIAEIRRDNPEHMAGFSCVLFRIYFWLVRW